MLLQAFMPAPDLADIVQTYRIVHFHFQPGQIMPPKAYPPRPEQCLCFYPHDRESVRYERTGTEERNVPVALYGQFSEVITRHVGRHFLAFQVVFLPGTIYRLTGMPSSEITNAYLDAETVFGTEVRMVNEQLFHADGYPKMIEIANNYVRGLVRRQRKPGLILDMVCAHFLKGDQEGLIRKIARDSCLSFRQIERKFKERVGINPKLYERIVRFDRAFRLKNTHPGMNWLRIAMDCNYHDYQHLVRDYKDLTGASPNAFHEIDRQAPERQFGLSEQLDNKPIRSFRNA
jgi:AraC-like DNA-binding protein